MERGRRGCLSCPRGGRGRRAELAGSRFQVHVLMDLEAGSRQPIELGSIQRQVKRSRDITFDDSAVSHAATTNVTSSVWR